MDGSSRRTGESRAVVSSRRWHRSNTFGWRISGGRPLGGNLVQRCENLLGGVGAEHASLPRASHREYAPGLDRIRHPMDGDSRPPCQITDCKELHTGLPSRVRSGRPECNTAERGNGIRNRSAGGGETPGRSDKTDFLPLYLLNTPGGVAGADVFHQPRRRDYGLGGILYRAPEKRRRQSWRKMDLRLVERPVLVDIPATGWQPLRNPATEIRLVASYSAGWKR